MRRDGGRRDIGHKVRQRVHALFDFRLQLMEEEIAAGWHCFHVPEIWLRQHLPTPHLDAGGRRHEIDLLDARLAQCGSDPRLVPASVMPLEGYRNFLSPGPLDVCGRDGHPGPRDLVANALTVRLVHEEDRHYGFEIRALELAWRAELAPGAMPDRTADHAERLATVLAPFQAVRDTALLIERDVGYWHARYGIGLRTPCWDIISSAESLTVSLMAQLAPDFAFRPKLDAARHLLFVQEAHDGAAWAFRFERISLRGQGQIDLMPQLVLLDAAALGASPEHAGKLGQRDLLFFDPVGARLLPVYETHELELQLRYTLERLRRLMAFYESCLAGEDCDA